MAEDIAETRGKGTRGLRERGVRAFAGRRSSLDPAAFADSVGNFGKRYSAAAGCPESLKCEALRRGRGRGRRGVHDHPEVRGNSTRRRRDAETPRRNAEGEQEFPPPLRPGALALNPVSERANVVVTADEAHRGGYGFVGWNWGQVELGSVLFLRYPGAVAREALRSWLPPTFAGQSGRG